MPLRFLIVAPGPLLIGVAITVGFIGVLFDAVDGGLPVRDRRQRR